MRALTLLLMAAIIPILHLPTDMPTAPDPVTPLTAPAAPTAPAVVLARPAGAAPSAPTVVLTRPAGGTPAAPVVVLTRPAGGAPAAPLVVMTRPAGSAPAAPVVVIARPSAAAPDEPDEVNPLLDPVAPDAPPAVMGAPEPVASVTIGSGNAAITYTLTEGVVSASVTHEAPAAGQCKTLWTMDWDNNALIIQPGSDARIRVTGTTPACPDVLEFVLQGDPDVVYYFTGNPGYGAPGSMDYWNITGGGSTWIIQHEVNNVILYQASSSDKPANPADATWNAPTTGTGTPVFTRLSSSANQVLWEIFMLEGILTAQLPDGSDGSGEVLAAETVWLGVEPQ